MAFATLVTEVARIAKKKKWKRLRNEKFEKRFPLEEQHCSAGTFRETFFLLYDDGHSKERKNVKVWKTKHLSIFESASSHRAYAFLDSKRENDEKEIESRCGKKKRWTIKAGKKWPNFAKFSKQRFNYKYYETVESVHFSNAANCNE